MYAPRTWAAGLLHCHAMVLLCVCVCVCVCSGVNNQEIALHIHPDSVLEQCTLRLYWNKLKIVLPEAVCIPTPATSPSPRRVSGGAQARGQDVGEMPGSGGDDADRGRGAAAAAASPPSPQTLRRSTRRAARASGGGGGANPTDTAAPAAGPAAAQAPAASPSNTHTTHTTRRSAGANRSTRDRLPAVAGGDEASEAGGPSSHEPATNRPETAGNAPANAESDEDLSGSCTTLPGFERLHSVVLDACFTLFPLQGGTSSEGLTRVVPLLSVLHGSRVADLRLDDGWTVSDEDLWAIVSNMRQITHLAVVGCNKITVRVTRATGTHALGAQSMPPAFCIHVPCVCHLPESCSLCHYHGCASPACAVMFTILCAGRWPHGAWPPAQALQRVCGRPQGHRLHRSAGVRSAAGRPRSARQGNRESYWRFLDSPCGAACAASRELQPPPLRAEGVCLPMPDNAAQESPYCADMVPAAVQHECCIDVNIWPACTLQAMHTLQVCLYSKGLTEHTRVGLMSIVCVCVCVCARRVR